MTRSKLSRFLINLAVVTVLMFLLGWIDFTRLSIQPANPWLPYFLSALLQSLGLLWAMRAARGRGLRLILPVGVLFYAVRTFLVAIEAFYLSTLLTPAVVQSILINGAVVTFLLVPAAAWLSGYINSNRELVGADRSRRISGQKRSPIVAGLGILLSALLAGLVWVILFIAVGLLVFQPVAGMLDRPALEAYMAGFSEADGMSILLFQWLRGIVWVLLALPLVRLLPASRLRAGLLLGGLFALWMGANLLIPAGLPFPIQVAHIAEVVVENFLFGLLTGLLFARPAEKEVFVESRMGEKQVVS